jgi:hypothetical protein
MKEYKSIEWNPRSYRNQDREREARIGRRSRSCKLNSSEILVDVIVDYMCSSLFGEQRSAFGVGGLDPYLT